MDDEAIAKATEANAAQTDAENEQASVEAVRELSEVEKFWVRREERRQARLNRVWPFPRKVALTTDDQRNIAAAEAKRERKLAKHRVA